MQLALRLWVLGLVVNLSSATCPTPLVTPSASCINQKLTVSVDWGAVSGVDYWHWEVEALQFTDGTFVALDSYTGQSVSLSVTEGASASSSVVTFDKSGLTDVVRCVDMTASLSVTLSYTDGSSEVCTVDVTGIDTEAPVLAWKMSETDASAPSASFPSPRVTWRFIDDINEAYYGVSTDGCDGDTPVDFLETVTLNLFNGQIYPGQGVHSLHRKYYAVDKCGHSSEFIQTIDVFDITPPEIVGPEDIVVDCADDLTACTVSATDDSGIEPWISTPTGTIISTGNGECDFTYNMVREWTATDHIGNVGTYQQTVKVIDNEAPHLTGVPTDDTTVPCDYEFVPVSATCVDNCDKTPAQIRSEWYDENSRTEKWCCTDSCGNARCQQQTATLVDDVPPIVPIFPNVTESCSKTGTSPLQRGLDCTADMIYDNCDMEPRWELHNHKVNGTCDFDYHFTQTYSAVDRSGNFASSTRIISVIDDIDPTMSPPVVSDATSECVLPPPVNRSAYHPCQPDISVIIHSDKVEGDDYNFTNVYTYTSTDRCGRSISDQATITVFDDQPPLITNVPADATVTCDAIPTADVNTVTYTENCCDFTTSYQETRHDGDCPNEFRLERVWSSVDCAGLTDSKTQWIQVNRKLPDVASAPGHSLNNEWFPAITHPLVNATFDIHCFGGTYFPPLPGIDYTETVINGDCTHEYTILRTWSVDDGCGVIAYTQTYTAVDTTAPVLSGIADRQTTCGFTDPLTWGITAKDPSYHDAADGDLTTSIVFDCADAVVDSCDHAGSRVCTVTVTDACGLTDTQVINETWDDTSIPHIFEGNKTSVDNCDATIETLYVDRNDTRNQCHEERIYVETWYTEDRCGNQAVDVVEKTPIFDQTPPVIHDVPDDVTLVCQNLPYPESGDVTATDNNDVAYATPVSLTFNTSESGRHACGHTMTRSWTVTDCAGFTTNAQQVITVNEPVEAGVSVFFKVLNDDGSMSTTLPADETLECPEVPGTRPTLVAITACGDEINVAGTSTPSQDGVTKYYDEAWTWNDGCQSISHSRRITVLDTTPPSVVTANTTNDCSEISNVPTATDLCDSAVDCDYTEVVSAGTRESHSFTVTRTWTCTDDQGLTTTALAYYTAVDDTPPTFVNKPADKTVSCSHTEEAVTYTDNCDSQPYPVTATVSGSVVNTAGTLTYVWDIVDPNGNPNSHTQVVTVEDITKPEFTHTADHMTVACLENVPEPVQGTATDNCGAAIDISVATVTNNPSCRDRGHTVHTWTATDVAGNVQTKSQTITYEDYTAPTIDQTFATQTVEWFTDVPSMFSADNITAATDDCGVLSDYTITCEYYNNSPDALCHRTHEWDCTIVDVCGNSKFYDKMFVVVEEDTRVPEFTPKYSNTAIACGEYPNMPTLPSSDTTNNVEKSTDVVDVWSGTAEDSFGCRTLTRTFTLEWCGKTDSHTQIINVIDRQTPGAFTNYSYPSDQCNKPAVGHPVSVDYCTGPREVVVTETSTPVTGGTEYVRTLTSVDDCGNHRALDVPFTVADTTPPSFQNPAPADATVEAPDAVPDAPTRVGYDNCDVFTITFEESSAAGGCANNYTVYRSWTITDSVGLPLVQSQTITKHDSTAPYWTVSVPADTTITYEKHVADNSTTFTPYSLTAADAAGAVTVEFDEVETRDPSAINNFVLTRTWRATDACGHSISHTQIITVTSPEPCLPPDENYECSDVITPASFFVDNCTDVMISVSVDVQQITKAGSCPDHYFIYRTYTITDADAINSIELDQTVMVQDSTPPVFDGPPTTGTTSLTKTQCDRPDPPTKTASDNCDASVEVTVEHTENDEFLHTYTYTATDDCGNTATTTHIETLVDERYVEWLAEPTADSAQCAEPVAPLLDCVAVCGKSCTVTKEPSDTVLSESCPRRIVRTWNALDSKGFSVSTTQTVTIDDTELPVVTTGANCSTKCDEECIHSYSATDNCDGILTATKVCSGDQYSGECTFTATDGCGNVNFASQTHEHAQEIAPTVDYAPADYVNNCQDMETIPQLTALDECDLSSQLTIVHTDVDISSGDCTSTGELAKYERQWVVTDTDGLTVTHNHTVTIKDNSPYVFNNAPTDSLIEVQCAHQQPTFAVTAHDDCAHGGAAQDLTPTKTDLPATAPSLKYVLTWDITDDCGRASTTDVTISVDDLTPPELIGVPDDLPLGCGESVPPPAPVTASDNCPGETTVEFLETPSGDKCTGDTTLTRVWTATDASGHTASKTQVITQLAVVAPVCVVTEADQSVECPSTLTAPIVTCTDSCTDEVLSYDTVKDMTTVCGMAESGSWSMTATESQCGFTHTVVQTRTVRDTKSPSLLNFPADATQDCVPADHVAPSCEDDCSGPLTVLSNTTSSSSQGCTDYFLTSYTCTDECGLKATDTVTMTATDTEPPVLGGMPEDSTVECPWTYTEPVVTATDNCDGDMTVVHKAPVALPTVSGQTVVEIRVYEITSTDTCGNTAEDAYTVTIEDTKVPSLSGNFDTIVLQCGTDAVPPMPVDGLDDCSSVSVVTSKETEQSCGKTHRTTHTWVGTDASGNTATESKLVIVVDSNAPVLSFSGGSGAGDITMECDADYAPPTCFANDHGCSEDVACEYVGKQSTPAGNGHVEVHTWTAQDGCGNSIEESVTVTFKDTTAPYLPTPPSNSTMDCTLVDGAITDPPVVDACDATPTLTVVNEKEAGSCLGSWVRKFSYTFSDDDGNTDTHYREIAFEDVTGPTLSVLNGDNVVSECSYYPQYPQPQPSASDDCGTGYVTTDHVSSVGTCSGDFTHTWTFSTSDDCGNQGQSKTVTHTVTDTEAPYFTPESVQATEDKNINAGSPFPPLPEVVAVEGCDQNSVTVEFDYVTSTTGCSNTHTRSWTATDDCGHSTRLEEIITESESVEPSFDGVLASMDVECGDNDWANSLPQVTATDRTGHYLNVSRSIAQVQQNSACICDAEYQVKYTAEDACGNAAEAYTTVTVTDTIAPSLSCSPADASFDCSAEVPPAEVVTSLDASFAGPRPVGMTEETTGNLCHGSTIRTYTISDCSSRVTTHQQTITYVDDTPPRFTRLPSDITVECGCDEIPAQSELVAIDNCDGSVPAPTVEETVSARVFTAGVKGVGSITRVYSTADTCGNQASHTHVISLEDTTAPTLSCHPEDKTLSCELIDEGDPAMEVFASDDCDASVTAPVFSQEVLTGKCDNEKTILRSWTATDSVGNAVTHEQTIAVSDTVSPVSLPAHFATSCLAKTNNIFSASIADMFPVYDNCDESGTSVMVTILSCNSTQLVSDAAFKEDCKESVDGESMLIAATTDNADNRVYYVHAELQDACGNTALAAYSITVFDDMEVASLNGCAMP